MKSSELLAKKAAISQRKVWEGHDNQDISLCLEGAIGVYSILTNVEPDKILLASRYLQKAYWMSDEAEKNQGFDSELEDKLYGICGLCLTKSRQILGLETKSVEHTVKWWKAYRHNDKEQLIENLVKEQILQMDLNKNIGVVDNYSQEKSVQQELNNKYVLANRCAGLFLEAEAELMKKDRVSVDKKLEEYFKIYLPRVIQFKE